MPKTMSETYLFRREFDAGDMRVRPMHVRIERLRLLIPAHRHSRTSYELHYTVQGRGSVTVNNIRYPISAGDMFVTGPEQMHEQLSNSDDPILEYCIYVSCVPKYSKEAVPLTGLRQPDFHIIRDHNKELFEMFRSIAAEMRADLADSEETACTILKLLLLKLNRMNMDRVRAENPRRTAGAAAYPEIEDAFFYQYDTLRLEDVANMLKISPRQTQRFLRIHYGKTFTEKCREARMSAAAMLLEDRSLSITEISVRVGFSSVEHFSSAFKGYFGASPRKYRHGFAAAR